MMERSRREGAQLNFPIDGKTNRLRAQTLAAEQAELADGVKIMRQRYDQAVYLDGLRVRAARLGIQEENDD